MTAHMLCGSPMDGTPLSELSNIHQRIDRLRSSMTETPTEDVLGHDISLVTPHLGYGEIRFGSAGSATLGSLPTGCFSCSRHAAAFLCGSVVFVDGGTDAYFRADDWPSPVPLYGLLSHLKRFRDFSASTPVAASN